MSSKTINLFVCHRNHFPCTQEFGNGGHETLIAEIAKHFYNFSDTNTVTIYIYFTITMLNFL